MTFIERLALFLPGVEARLLPAKEGVFLNAMEKQQAPGEFIDLYRINDGEGSSTPGIFGGFSWLSSDEVRQSQLNLETAAQGERYSHIPGMVKETGFSVGWIPFAQDHGGSFLALDLDPGPHGRRGQVITLDRDTDEIFVLAGSFGGFCDFIIRKIQEGLIKVVDQGDLSHFEWHSGHLFNDMTEFSPKIGKDSPAILTDFWVDYFKAESAGGQITAAILAKVKSVVIGTRHSPFQGRVTLDILGRCPNLSEIICHHPSISSFEILKKLPNLKKLYVSSPAFDQETLESLVECLELRDLGLISLNLTSIKALQKIDVKILSLVKTNLADPSEIGSLKSLTELHLDALESSDLSWLDGLKNLKILTIKKIPLLNLSFLVGLGKLTEFETGGEYTNSGDDKSVAGLKFLKSTDWPFSDLSLLKNNKILQSIGVHAKLFKNPEALASTAVSGITVHFADSEEEAQGVVDAINKHKSMRSTGWAVTWT